MLSNDSGLIKKKVDGMTCTSLNEQSEFNRKQFDLHSIAPLQRYICYTRLSPTHLAFGAPRNRIVVSTLHCVHNNPGSNPGHGGYAKEVVLSDMLSTASTRHPVFQITAQGHIRQEYVLGPNGILVFSFLLCIPNYYNVAPSR